MLHNVHTPEISKLPFSFPQVQFQGILFILTIEYGCVCHSSGLGLGRAWIFAKFRCRRYCWQWTGECSNLYCLIKISYIFNIFCRRFISSVCISEYRGMRDNTMRGDTTETMYLFYIRTGGASAFASALMLGPRIGRYTEGIDPLPLGNPVNACMGLFVLWWGWLAFNSGSTYGVSGAKWQYAARAAVMTMMGCK